MKRIVTIRATVIGDVGMRAAEYVGDALEVGLDGGPQEDYNVTSVTVDEAIEEDEDGRRILP